MRDPPDRGALLALHGRLLGGDRLASDPLTQALLPFLLDAVAGKFPRTDEHLVGDGVIDAILDYCAHPQQFDASHGVPLDQFLSAAARRNLSNLLRGELRRKQREKKVGGKRRAADVALDPAAGNIRREELQQVEERKKAMFDALDDPTDKEVLALRLQGVKDTAAFARILGVAHLPDCQRRAEVKRHKDRIIRFLRRKGLLP